jgi:copper chaperone
MEHTTFDVKGMTCGGCVASVKRVLEALPGVSNVDVKLSPGRASADYDPDRITPEALRDAVQNAGYDVPA